MEELQKLICNPTCNFACDPTYNSKYTYDGNLLAAAMNTLAHSTARIYIIARIKPLYPDGRIILLPDAAVNTLPDGFWFPVSDKIPHKEIHPILFTLASIPNIIIVTPYSSLDAIRISCKKVAPYIWPQMIMPDIKN